MTDPVFLSPSRLATYATCQRKFDFDYVQEVDAPDRTEYYMNQGRAYHETIEDVCEATSPDENADSIYRRALDAFEGRWRENLDSAEYASEAHEQYQRAENLAAIEAFFDPEDGDGIEHARRSVGTEEWVRSTHGDIGLWGKVDNILETEDGLHCIDYKRGLGGVLTPRTAEHLLDHRDGTEHAGRKRLKNAFQTATYIEGVKTSGFYEEGMSVRFSFYGLLYDTEHLPAPTGYAVSARGRPRETTHVYEEFYDVIWDLIENAHAGIVDGDHEPDPFDVVTEEVCPDCEFREACPERLSREVMR